MVNVMCAKKFLLSVLALLFCVVLSVSVLPVSAVDDADADYDIVFVLDVSKSMKYSDKPRLAIQAVDLFVNTIPATVTRVGIVAYAGEVIDTLPLTTDKSKVFNFVQSLDYDNPNTDIPAGLIAAKNLLESGGVNDNEKVIIMLTDGINEKYKNRTDEMLKNDLETAENSGYRIFTIGLNCAGKVKKEYLKAIADKTSAESFIVSKATDLKSVFDKINASIFNVELVYIDEKGNLTVPDDEVVEAIIEIYHENPISWVLTDPSGNKYSSANNQISVNELDLYTAITVSNPTKGLWNVGYKRLAADDKTKIITTCILSYNVSVTTEVSAAKIEEKDKIDIRAKLYDSQQLISNKSGFFSKYTCTAVITAPNGVKENVLMTATDSGYAVSYTPKNGTGIYTVSCSVKGDKLSKKSADVTFDVSENSVIKGNSGDDHDLFMKRLIIIGAALIAAIIIAIVVIKLGRKKKVNLSGTIRYSCIPAQDGNVGYNSVDLSNHGASMRVSELFFGNEMFSKAQNIILFGDYDDNKIPIVKVKIDDKCTDTDINVIKSGAIIGKTPVTFNDSETIVISWTEPEHVSINLLKVR